MNFNVKQVASKISSLFYVPVRHRYYAEKIAKGPLVRGYGYEDKVSVRGVLPRLEEKEQLPRPEYEPGNPWHKKKASFGQNDYIDIFGDGKLNPVKIMYDVPNYLRGIKGNEMQLLIAKINFLCQTNYPDTYPRKWYHINRRLMHLYKHLNRKTKTGVTYKQ